jgi:hypothetical protein
MTTTASIRTAPSATTTSTVRSTVTSVRASLPVVGLTVLAASAVWLVGTLAGADLRVAFPGQAAMTVSLPSVVVAASVAALTGWAALALLRRVTPRGRTVWTALAVVALVASFAPVATTGASGGTRLVLALMHVAVAAVLIPGLRRTVGDAGPVRP